VSIIIREMSSASVRRRPALGSNVHFNTDGETGSQYDAKSLTISSTDANRRRLPLPTAVDGSVWLLTFAFFATIVLFVHTVFKTLPAAVTIDNANAGQFVEERARNTLNDLTAFGARPVGSKANEDLAVDYILNEIIEIQRHMRVEQHSMDVDVQRVSGTFSLDFLGHFTNCYDNVNNIIVKLCPKHGSNDSLLVNCHYDTAVNSTGKIRCHETPHRPHRPPQ